MSTVAMKPNTGAPVGNSILAVLIGFGQRRTLLTPLIKKRQPKMTRRTASAINTTDEGSKAFLLPVRQTNDANYSESAGFRQLPVLLSVVQLLPNLSTNKWNSIVSSVEIIYNLAIYEFQLHGMWVARYGFRMR